ncbi:IS1595 family transposase, partial [Neisseria gonorrhoeae]
MLPSKYEDNTLQIKERNTERTAPFFCTGSYR